MDAVLISNRKIEQEIGNVKDLFQLMLKAAGHKSQAKKKIKVLYFLNSVVRAGAEEHVLQLIERLNKDEFEPVLVCPQKLIDLIKKDLERLQIRFYPVYIRRWRNFGEIKKF
jgi:fructose-specific component phosphotransferase system IIB-like protein